MTPYFSSFITYSRLPIILGVVCIHAGFCSDHGWLYFFMGECFGRIAVPLFFAISGYLFFQNYLNTKRIFFEKLKRRAYSLLIPYLLWNLIAFVVYYSVTETMTIDQFFQAFWVVDGKTGHSPADGPLWFVRSLMLYSIIAPFFFLLNRHRIFSWVSPIVLIPWVLDVPLLKSGFFIGLIFFNLGAWISLTNKDFVFPVPTKMQSVAVFIVYAIGSAIHFYFRAPIIHNITILLGFVLIYCIPSIARFRWMRELGSLSFGLYCMHEIVLEIIKVLDIPLEVGNLKYCFAIVVTTLISLLFCWILQKNLPTVAKYLLGNRK